MVAIFADFYDSKLRQSDYQKGNFSQNILCCIPSLKISKFQIETISSVWEQHYQK